MNNKAEKPDKKRRTLCVLLSFIIVFSTMAANIPSVSAAEEPQPNETPQVTEESQPSGTPQATEEPQPTETPQATEEPQPAETVQPTEAPQQTEKPQLTGGFHSDVMGDFKVPKTSKPGKGSLSADDKKLSTRILQLINDKYLPAGITRGQIISQMSKQKQVKQGKEATDVPNSTGTSVHVYIKSKKGSDLKALSKYAQIEDTDEKNGLAAAWVDVSMIKSLASLDSVQSVREVIPPYVRAGSAMSEGDSMLNADDVRNTMGVDGTGVKIGIISDGVDSLSSAVASGDLPNGANAVHVLSNDVGGDEGTAMLEIVHDLAPGAELYFHDLGGTTISFNAAITELAQEGCDIICDDIGWIEEPFFEDGSIAQHVASVMSTYGVIYVSSAGNAAADHYQGEFVDFGIDLFGDECPTADFSGDGEDPFLYVKVPADYPLIAIIEWDDPFGNSANDYDVDLYDCKTGDYLGGSYEFQDGIGCDPLEEIFYYNESSTDQDVYIRVYKCSDVVADKTLEIYTYYGNTYPTNVVAADSIFGHPAVPGVLACGAIDGNSADGADYGSIEYFSSQGPVTMISETRQKPDICGIDGVSVTGAGEFPNPFYGTSAAAPHIAAAAALLKSMYPEDPNSDIKQMMLDNIVDMGSSGYDNTYGYGRADVLAAVRSNSCEVTFDSQGGSEIETQWIIKGGKITRPPNPVRTDWFFAGWYMEDECLNAWNFENDAVTADTTLYAKWKDSRDVYTISADGSYDARTYGDISQVVIDSGLNVTLMYSGGLTLDMQIIAGAGVSLTIDGLSIQCSNESALSFTGSGNSLVLSGENSLKSGPGKPGIKVEEGTSLDISGDGYLSVVSGSGAAGIGGGNGANGGSVSVSGGTVCIRGTGSPYDLGSGDGGTGGSFSISGNSAVLLANGTCPAPITSTHELITTNAVQKDIILGKIKLPEGWPRPVYVYANSSAIGTLTYDGNGGAGSVPDAVVQYNGTSTQLSKGIGLYKGDYPAASWNTLADGLGTGYAAGSAYTFSGDATLYAVYASYTVTGRDAFGDLGFVPMDSAIDPERPVIYMTESGGSKLYRVDLNTGKIGYVEFPYTAERLTVKNDKIYVTLPVHAHVSIGGANNGYIGVVDAASFTIDKTFQVAIDPYDIEADDTGRVYIGSGSNQWTKIMVYDTVTAGQIDTFSPYEYQSLLDFNPVYNKLYSITAKSDPRDIIGYEITDGDITKCYDSPYYGDYYMTTYIKVSPDGQYIFNGSGNVFKSKAVQTGDMVYTRNIGRSFSSICFDTSKGEFYAANGNRLYIYNYNTWTLKGAQGSGDSYKDVYCNGSSFASWMQTSGGKNYIAINDRTSGINATGVTVCQSASIMKGKTAKLAAAITPSDATNSNVAWKSSNESVATVSNGVVTAVNLGTAVITATTEDGGFSDTCSVTVVSLAAYNAYSNLGFTPMDTAADPGSNAVYMTESGGNRLLHIDLSTGEKSEIYFPYKAERLTVKKGKVYVTLPHGIHDPNSGSDGEGSVAVVDAVAFTIDNIFDVVPDPYDIEVDGAGRAYIGSGSGQLSLLTVYDTGTGLQIDSHGGYKSQSLLDFNQEYNRLYSITKGGSSPTTITAYQIGNGRIIDEYTSPEWAYYDLASYMKISPDGQLLFDGSGDVFWCDSSQDYDMEYLDTIDPFTSICFDLPNDSIYTANGSKVLKVYSYDSINYDEEVYPEYTRTLTDNIIKLMHDGNKVITLQKNTYGKYYLGAILPAPETVAAVPAGYNSVKVTWSAVDGATGYLLYRSTSQYGTYSLIKTTSALSYTSAGLNTGTTYYYKVRAYKGSSAAAGDFSGIASATPVLNEMSGVKAATYYPTAIKISWNAVPGRTKYYVSRSDTLDGEYKYIGSTTYTYYNNTGLAVDKTYYYKVQAYRLVGTRRVYNEKSEPVSDTTRVFQVTNVKAKMYSVTSNKIYWSSVPGISGYEILGSESEDGVYSLIGKTGYTYYYNKNLVPNKTYYYKVKAYRTVGTVKHYGPESVSASAMPVFNDVTNVKASMYSVTNNKITWSAVSGRTGYEVSWSESEDGTYTKLPVTAYTYIYHSIDPAKAYYYKVAAYVTVNGVRQYSAESAPVRAYNKVNGVKGYMYSVTSNKIYWSSVASRSRYEVWWSDSRDGTYTMLPATTYTYIYHINIDPEKTYYYKVLAYQLINGNKVYTNDYDIVEVINKVGGAKAACYSYTSNKISWSSVSGRDYYEIWRFDPTADDYVYLAKTGYTYYYDKNLTTDTTYYYKVRASDTVSGGIKYSGFSDVVSAKPILKAVSGAQASRYSSSKIKLTWYSVSGATGYEIQCCTTGNDEDFVRINTTASTYYYNGGLTSGTVYYYRVRAVRTIGENTYYGGWSKKVSAKP